jgi:TP901 family phage tail tape measure protein
MADEVLSKLGFNVDNALSAIDRIDAKLQTLQGAFQQFAGALGAWNANTSGVVNVLTTIADNASKAASAMGRLNREYAKAVSPPPSTVAGPSGSLPATSAQGMPKLWVPPDYSQAVNGANQVADAVDKADKATQSATAAHQSWVVSWQTLGRIVMTQAIVRALSQIRNALSDAVTESIEFQRRIAEVQTIAPQLGGSFGQLTSEAADFARQFNVPLAQATEGLYQTISNQFTGMSERANVMQGAMKLAKVGVMDFQDAILLITGTLNAYGMTSEQADAVAAKFFTTIRLGRVRGKELADTMGQVMPIASELGVSLDEVNSAMVAMTIGGMDAHKSVTALRGAMTAFLKPSEDMKKVVRELGFTSAEQLVQAKGFQGALEAVAGASDHMASQIAKSFRNVRALTAELRLTGSGAKQVEEAMQAMQASTPEALSKVYEQFKSTDAEKLTTQINALKINLTQDFGGILTHVLAQTMQMVGGANNLSAAIQAIAVAAIPAAAALGVLGVAAMAAQVSLGPIGWIALGATAAISALFGGMSYFTAKSINETRQLSNEQRQATLEYIKNKEEELRALRETEEKKRAEENRNWEDRASKIRREYFKALDDLKDKNKEIIESDRQVMQSMVTSQERVVAAYRNAANAALRIVQESQNRRVSLESEYSDLMFRKWMDEDVKFEGSQKARLLLERSWGLEAEANRMIAKAQTEDDVRRAAAIQQRAKSFLDEGTTLAKEVGDTWLQEQAHRSIRTNLEARINAEKKLEEMQAARAQSLADEAAKEQKRLDEMKALMKDILADLQAFDKHGAKSPQALAEQQARLDENIAQFKDLWLGGKKVEVADLLAFDQLQRRVTLALEGGVSQAEVKQLYSAPETFAKFREDIERGVGPVRVMIDVGRIGGSQQMWEATKGMTAEETIAHFSQELQRATKIIDSYNATKDALKSANTALELGQGEIKSALDRWANVGWIKDLDRFGGLAAIIANKNSLFPGRFQPIRDALIALEGAIDKFNTPGAQPSTEDLDKLKVAYDQYLEAVRPSAASKAGFEEFMKKANLAVDAAQRVQKIEAGLKAMEPSAAEAEQNRPAIENALKAAEEAARKAKESVGETRDGAEAAGRALGQVSQIDMSNLVRQTQDIADAMWSAAMASQSVQAPAWEMTAAHGGKAWNLLALGGRPQGTDVIPAMLSPGEVVINAASARRFAAQLTAINAGVQPVYRSEGGSVTNIGDINVTVNGGGTSRQTARSIAAELRRELRRGTATL